MRSERPTRNDGVLSQRAGDTLVLLDPQSGEYFSLDEVGARIWELCDGSRNVGEIAAALSEEFDESPSAIEPDARELLAMLSASRLLRSDG